jgi:hypothetical protein
MRNKKNAAALLLVATIGCCAGACYLPRYVYAPHDAVLPLLKGKEDVEATALYAGDGAELHSAWAPASHLGVTLNAGFRMPRDHEQTTPGRCSFCAPFFDTSLVRYHRSFLELGAGYFNRFPFSRRLGYALYAGGGPGAFSIREHGVYRDTDLAYSRHLRARSTALFIQPSVSLRGGWVDAALGYRLFWIRYSHERSTYTPQEEVFYHLDVLRRRWLYFTEPVFVLRVHDPTLPWLMLELQWVATLSRSEIDFQYRMSTGGIGAVIDLGSLKGSRGAKAGSGKKDF